MAISAERKQHVTTALEALLPGDVRVAEMDDSAVVYAYDPAPKDPDVPVTFYQREFVVAEDGAVTFTGAAQRVVPVSRFASADGDADDPGDEDGQDDEEVVVAAAAKKPCGCQSQEKAMHRHAERIRALIDNPKVPFAAEDQSFLEGLSDERFSALEASVMTGASMDHKADHKADHEDDDMTDAEKKDEMKDAEAAKPSVAEFLAQFPEIEAIVAKHKAAEAAKRGALISGLAGKQSAFTEPELVAMPTEQLEKIAALANVAPATVDYSGMGAPRGASQHASVVEPPDPWAAALAARKGA